MPRGPTQRSPFSPLRDVGDLGAWRGLLVGCVLCLAACTAYDADLLRRPDPGSRSDAGPRDGGRDGSGEADGGDEDGGGAMCMEAAEQCNRVDDDCDGRTDEDTAAFCEATVMNARTQCVAINRTASCVTLGCLPGFVNCDGDPANGCEPYCSCNACDDAGTEDGGL